MPDYKITIHMKVGKTKIGVRWHPSYDTDFVRGLVEAKVRKTVGMSIVKYIEVNIVSRTTGDKMDSMKLDV